MFQQGAKVLIVFIVKRLSTHDLDLAVHGGPRMNCTLAKPLSFGRCCRDLCRLADAAVTSRLAEVDVKNVCVFELGVMHCIYGDDVNELLE